MLAPGTVLMLRVTHAIGASKVASFCQRNAQISVAATKPVSQNAGLFGRRFWTHISRFGQGRSLVRSIQKISPMDLLGCWFRRCLSVNVISMVVGCQKGFRRGIFLQFVSQVPQSRSRPSDQNRSTLFIILVQNWQSRRSGRSGMLLMPPFLENLIIIGVLARCTAAQGADCPTISGLHLYQGAENFSR